jgi:hypothetical protein
MTSAPTKRLAECHKVTVSNGYDVIESIDARGKKNDRLSRHAVCRGEYLDRFGFGVW